MKEQQDYENAGLTLQIGQRQYIQQATAQIQVNYRQEYTNLLGFDQKNKINTLAQDLKQHDIQYNELEDHNQFYIQLLHHSKNYRALTIKVTLGPFTTILTIFNQAAPSFVHELNCLFGCCGNVYLLQWGSEEKIAVKCILMNNGSHSSIFLRTIKQYTINKIASALRLGPKLIKIQQFDLIIYEKCIEFCMEKCLLAEEYTFNQQDHLILKKKLRTLHELKIVHCDIKPSNIVYSQSFKSPVFLDFGFSKILSTGVGVPVKTKFVGSLESCCKQMMDLYVKKNTGYVDLYYNDAYSLDVASKSDPIRQTGNDLEQIIKFCDPTLSNFHYIKIFFSLYNDQIFNATNEFLVTNMHDKKFKIMRFLDMLTPTQNLREFYFKFFNNEWNESIQFSDSIRSYNHSHRHQLQLDMKCQFDYRSSEVKTSEILSEIIPKVFNVRINLFELDNDLINFQQDRIGLKKFFNNSYQNIQEMYDFFLSHVGIINVNHFIQDRKPFSLSWQICDHFFIGLPDQYKKTDCKQQKMLNCFKFITKYCLENSLTIWKIKTFQRTINEQMAIKKINFLYFQKYLMQIINLKCQIENKLNILVLLINSLRYQISVWGYMLKHSKDKFKDIQQRIQKIQNQFYRLTSEDYLKAVIKLDFFLLKSLIIKQNTIDSFHQIQKQLLNLKQQDREHRKNILKFIKIIYFYDLSLYQQTRVQIERTFAVSQIPIILKPQYFLLCNVYFMLNNMERCKKLYFFLKQNIMISSIIDSNPNIKYTPQQQKDQLFFQKLNTNIQQIAKPYQYFPYVFKYYLGVKKTNIKKDNQILYNIILSITKDVKLIECLKKLDSKQSTFSDKIYMFQRVLQYFKDVLNYCQSEQAEYIKENYIIGITLQCAWLKQQYDQIIKYIDQNKLIKNNYVAPVQNNIIVFDYLIKCNLIINKIEKVKKIISPILDYYVNKLFLVQKWIGTTTFIVIFQSILQDCFWSQFRDFLLIIVDFIDIHPTQSNINSYILCIRYALSQKIDISQIDNGLSTIQFPKYEWKYPLLSFFHLEALRKMIYIQDYLNKKQLKLYLYRLSLFLPFLKHAQLVWIMQQYYQIALKINQRERFRRFILRRSRKLVNYIPQFRKNNYYLNHIEILDNSQLMKVILDKQLALDSYLHIQNRVLMSSFKTKCQFFSICRQKLQNLHQNAGNQSLKAILLRHKQLMRLKIEQEYQKQS